MSRTQRFAVLGLAAALLVAGFVIARSTGSDDSGPTATRSGSSTGPASRRPPQIPTITVKDAKPVGGIRTLSWKQGSTIDFKVRSDTADEVHFHGYDVMKDVARGGVVRFRLKATIEGRFVVELEDHEQQIATVEVRP